MIEQIMLLTPDLALFDGEGGGTAGGAAPTGGTQAGPDSTRPGNTGGNDLSNVAYGKQEGAPDAGERQEPTAPKTAEARRAEYDRLISSPEYKEFYTQDTQAMINRRFAETKGLREQLDAVSPVIELMLQKFGLKDGDMDALMEAIEGDNSFWEEAAEDAGMTVEDYKKVAKMERKLAEANRRLEQVQAVEQQRKQDSIAQQKMLDWIRQTEELKGLYPSIDLETEGNDPTFQFMLSNGFSVKDAYEFVHRDEIMNAVAQANARNAAQMITDNIRARGRRPAENGARNQAGIVTKTDVSQLTKEDRAEIARRAARGEKISF